MSNLFERRPSRLPRKYETRKKIRGLKKANIKFFLSILLTQEI
jgi:hypothetical protein